MTLKYLHNVKKKSRKILPYFYISITSKVIYLRLAQKVWNVKLYLSEQKGILNEELDSFKNICWKIMLKKYQKNETGAIIKEKWKKKSTSYLYWYEGHVHCQLLISFHKWTQPFIKNIVKSDNKNDSIYLEL